MNITLYYFSGSGNTLKVANIAKDAFLNKNHSVTLRNMEAGYVIDNNVDLIGLLFPVALQSTFPNVWNFFQSLPNSNKTNVFMIDTLQSFSGGIVGPLKKLLVKKNYTCIASLEVKMTSSMSTDEKRFRKDLLNTKKANRIVMDFIDDLLKGKTKWKRYIILPSIIRLFSRSSFLWHQISKLISVNHTKCIQCGLCENNCPMKAISLKSGKVVIDNSLCISCMRCVNNCPTNSILVNKKIIIQNKNNH